MCCLPLLRVLLRLTLTSHSDTGIICLSPPDTTSVGPAAGATGPHPISIAYKHITLAAAQLESLSARRKDVSFKFISGHEYAHRPRRSLRPQQLSAFCLPSARLVHTHIHTHAEEVNTRCEPNNSTHWGTPALLRVSATTCFSVFPMPENVPNLPWGDRSGPVCVIAAVSASQCVL